MLHRIIVNVMEVVHIVPFISHDVVPKSSLPQSGAFGYGIHFLEIECNIPFDRMHNLRDAGVGENLNKEMEMIGQKHKSSHAKRILFLDSSHSLSQYLNIPLFSKD